MIKKLSLLLLCLSLAFGSFAQNGRPASQGVYRPGVKTTTVDSSDIQYWVGSGSSYAILVVSWTPTGNPNFAWGFRWDANANPDMTAADMMDSIQAHDSRLTIYGHTEGFVTEIEYSDGTYSLSGADIDPYSYWMYMGNNVMASVGITGWELESGDVIEWAFTTDWSNMFPPIVVTPATDPNPSTPTEITVNAANPDTALVDYWCGTGSNKAVVVIGWDDATPATALCWGVRWNGNTTAMGALDSIVAHDSHFTYTHGGMISNLAYNNGSLNLASPTDWWCYTRNGSYAGAYASQQIANNDVLRLSATCTQSLSTAIVVPNPNPGVNPPSQPDPVDATIAESDILYWVGTGSNSARFIVNWADTCLAWGYHFNGSNVNLLTLMDSISAADPRFSYHLDWGFVDSINFVENGRTFAVTPNHYFFLNKNGVYSEVGADLISVANGDYIKFGDETVSTWIDSTWYGTYWYPTNMLWQNQVYPVSAPAEPLPVDASIPASDILYWVGTGSNEARFFVSYAQPDTCLAWGYRFSTPTITASQMVMDIAAADPRLSIQGDPSYVGDILYAADNGDTLRLSPVGALGYNFWWTIKNGTSAMSGIGEVLANGDYFKYGDMNSAVCADPEPDGYCLEEVWTALPVPVAVPTPADPVPVDTDINPSDILYWVGTGSHAARFIANWADTSLAWGYRFSQDSVSVLDMMAAIDEADPRFSIQGSNAVSDILFVEDGDTLKAAQNDYWMFNVNGISASDYADAVYVRDGDMAKFGVASDATVTATEVWDGVEYPVAMVWERSVYPVSIPVVDDPDTNHAVDASIAESDILFWIGKGTKNITFIVNWADTALAWGYKTYSDSVTVKEVMDQVMVNDYRFSYVAAGGFVNNIYFAEDGDTLSITPGQFWSYNINGAAAQNLYINQRVGNHDVIKWGDPSVGVVTDSSEMGGVWWPSAFAWEMAVHPASVVDLVHGPFCGAVGTEGCEAIPANSDRFVAWAEACELELGYQNIATQGALVSYGEAEDAVGACDTVDNLSVVSLGDGGTATITFSGHIFNGEGPDFAVFENSFDDSFLELAFVEVSSDGEHFVRFPATSLTQTIVQVGSIGIVDPTNINNLAGKYRHGWGTPFDLDELRDSANLDINNITHVRIVDVVGSIDPRYATYDAFGNIVNDPWPTESYSSGFDLDGVGAIHYTTESTGIQDADAVAYSIYSRDRLLSLRGAAGHHLSIYDVTGRRLVNETSIDGKTYRMPAAGVYLIQVDDAPARKVVVM